jgi:hypothetical protein
MPLRRGLWAVAGPVSVLGAGFLAASPVLGAGCTSGEAAAPYSTPLVRVPQPPVQPSPLRGLRRLSSREYDAVVLDLLGDTTQPAAHFLADVYPNGYDNGATALAVQSDQAEDYETAAEALAASAVQSSMNLLVGDCDPTASGAGACLESFLGSFAARAYRRPLTDTEKQRLRDAYAIDGPPSFAAGLQTVLEVILQSPQFLYREELGPMGDPGESGTEVQLTDAEVASELSFFLTGTMPDATLWAAVQNGAFHTTSDIQREAARLLGTPAAQQAMRTFLHEWLGTNLLSGLSKDATVYPAFDSTMAASMTGELDRFYDDVVWNGAGSLRSLFTSTRSFANSPLATLYGVSVSGTDYQAVTLDPATRTGVMTRSGFLAVHAATDDSNPIARGVFLLSSIMCMAPHPPPANVPLVPPASDPSVQGLTTRQRYDQHVTNSFCASCHTQIDGLGFGFEEFDGIGAFRATDNGQPVDSSGNIVGTGEIDGPFQGAADLAKRLAGSRLLANCFARQAYRYAMGRVESPQQDLDFLDQATSPDARMTDALMAIVANHVFSTRTVE